MQKFIYPVLTLTLIAGLVYGQRTSSSSRPIWETKVVSFKESFSDGSPHKQKFANFYKEISQAGSDGWELVFVNHWSDHSDGAEQTTNEAILKRRSN